MREVSRETAYALWGMKEGSSAYPCYWCGVVTALLSPEDFSECEQCQTLHAKIGFAEMNKRYPLASTDERNPEFFKAENDRLRARAENLSTEEMTLIDVRGCHYEREHIARLRAGGALTGNEKIWLGRCAEKCVDNWTRMDEILLNVGRAVEKKT